MIHFFLPVGLRDFFVNMRFEKKIILISVASALFVALISLFSFKWVSSTYNNVLYEQTASALSFFSNETSFFLSGMETLSSAIFSNQTVQQSLKNISAASAELSLHDMANTFTEVLYRYINPQTMSITVVTPQQVTITAGRERFEESPETLGALISQAAGAEGAVTWFYTGDPVKMYCIRQIREIEKLSLKPLGTLIIRVDLDNIVKNSQIYRQIEYENALIYITDGDNIIYPRLQTRLKLDFDKIFAITKIDGQRLFVVRAPISRIRANFHIFFGISYDVIFRSVLVSNIVYIVAMLLGLVGTFVFSRLVCKNITYSFNCLITKMNRLKSGNFEPYGFPVRTAQDELGLLNRYFDEMTVAFKKQIDDTYIKEMLISQARLKMLEQQIDPHFLYNTLQSINWFAKRSGEKNISTMVESLGSLLRSILNENQDVLPLHRELAIVENYVKIQKIRFSDSLSVNFTIDETCRDVLVPKMSIQPLVENAILHSRENSFDEQLLVEVLVTRSGQETGGGFVTVCVKNTGPEIDEQALEKLRSGVLAAQGNGVGLLNIDARIKILFGEQSGITLKNSDGAVLVSFQVPFEYTVEQARREIRL